MKLKPRCPLLLLLCIASASVTAVASDSGGAGTSQAMPSPPVAQAAPAYDADLARRTGADDHGMRRFVLVILKTGPKRVPDGAARDEMFRGHFANMQRLAADGKLVLAGPLDQVDGWRGLFVLATDDLEEAKALVATDPVVVQGEMVAEYHRFYGSAALVLVNDWHERLAKPGAGMPGS